MTEPLARGHPFTHPLTHPTPPSALHRKALHEIRLRVTRTGAFVRRSTFEHPHQRALDSLNRPRPSEQEPPDHQPGT